MILTKHDGVCGYGMKENSGDIIHLHALETILFTVSGNFSKWESYFVHKIFSAMGVCLFVFFGGQVILNEFRTTSNSNKFSFSNP